MAYKLKFKTVRPYQKHSCKFSKFITCAGVDLVFAQRGFPQLFIIGS